MGVLFGSFAQILAESFTSQSTLSFLSINLTRQSNLDENGIGVFFFRFTSVAIVSTLFLLFVPYSTNKLFFIFPGYFILAAAAFLTGPSKLLGLLNNIDLMTTGMYVAGVGKGLMYTSLRLTRWGLYKSSCHYMVWKWGRVSALPNHYISPRKKTTHQILLQLLSIPTKELMRKENRLWSRKPQCEAMNELIL